MNSDFPSCRRVRRSWLGGIAIAVLLTTGCSGSDSTGWQDNGIGVGGGTAAENRGEGGSAASSRTTNPGAPAVGGRPAAGGHTATGGSATPAVGSSGGEISRGGNASDSSRGRVLGGSQSTGGVERVVSRGGGDERSASAAAGRAGSVDAPISGGTKQSGGMPSSGARFATGGVTPNGTKASAGMSGVAGSRASAGARNLGGTHARGGAGASGGGVPSGGVSNNCYATRAEEIGTQARADLVSGYGTVAVWARAPRQIVRLQTNMVVPPKPPASGTLFLWPGLQPYGANFEPIDNGVLQPVLTWGPTCAPVAQPRVYSTWWISGQYVNTNGSVPGYTDCNSGPAMSVNVCDTLEMDLALSGTIWRQTVIDVQTNQTVTYDIDMQNQAQNIAYFVIEEYSSTPTTEVIFTDTTITFDSSDVTDCRVYMRGETDFVSSPTVSSDGLHCSIPQIILRAKSLK